MKRKNMIQLAREAQLSANLNQLGRLINSTKTRKTKARILGMLACEYMLRKNITERKRQIALYILSMARAKAVDEYNLLETYSRQEDLINQLFENHSFAKEIIVEREKRSVKKL